MATGQSGKTLENKIKDQEEKDSGIKMLAELELMKEGVEERMSRVQPKGLKGGRTGGVSGRGGGPGRKEGQTQTGTYTKELVDLHAIHEAIIDALIQNPTLNNKQLAQAFEMSAPYIGRIIQSDIFRSRLIERKAELIDPLIMQGAEERLKALMVDSMEVLAEKLALNPNADLAMETLKVSSKALGYGAVGGNQQNLQVNFVVALPGKEKDAKKWSEKHKELGAGTSI